MRQPLRQVGLLQDRDVLAGVLDLVRGPLLDDVLDLVEDRLERRMLDDVQLLRLHEGGAFLVQDRRVHLAQAAAEGLLGQGP